MENKENNAYEFDKIANGPFLPVYPVIAEQIVEKTGISSGTCIDVGSGGGHLGLCMLKITNLNLVLIDNDKNALDIAMNRAAEWGLSQRASVLLADAVQIPLDDNSIDLCVSRGSMWFWESQKKGFEEIYRVLDKGGMAYIGCGFGNQEIKEQVDKDMKKIDNEWPKKREKFLKDNTPEHFTNILKETVITNFEVINDEKGLWIIFTKE